MAEIKVEDIEIEKLIPATYNPREMNEEEMEKLVNSLKKFGQVDDIVINKDMTIIGGHQRVSAAKRLGWTKVKCKVLDLDKDNEKLLNLAMNKIVGRWNEDKLLDLIKYVSVLPEVGSSGFNKEEIDQYLFQFDIRGKDSLTFNFEDDAEDLKKVFERNERVEVAVEVPETPIRKNKIAFYCQTMEQYEKINNTFKTGRQGELDIEKFLNFLTDANTGTTAK